MGSRLHETDRDLLQNLLPSECILERVDSRSKFSAMAQYANSKLLFIMFVSELAQQIAEDKVIINSVCPRIVPNLHKSGDVYPLCDASPLLRARMLDYTQCCSCIRRRDACELFERQ